MKIKYPPRESTKYVSLLRENANTFKERGFHRPPLAVRIRFEECNLFHVLAYATSHSQGSFVVEKFPPSQWGFFSRYSDWTIFAYTIITFDFENMYFIICDFQRSCQSLNELNYMSRFIYIFFANLIKPVSVLVSKN